MGDEYETLNSCQDIEYVRENYKECCPVTVGPSNDEVIFKNCGTITREKMDSEQKRIEGMQNQDGECYICSSISGNIENGVLLFILLVLLFIVFRKDIKKIKFFKKLFK